MSLTRYALHGQAFAASCLFALLAASAQAQPERLNSEMMPLAASQALILDIADAASRAVAVGERGQILVSESRSEWRQVPDVPTRSTLTAVSAVGDLVWAVGHDGVILASSDGGLTWTVQREDVLRSDDDVDAEFDPRQGVPLLDILMLSADHGFAVGAYSQLLRTDDGGASWVFVPTGDDALDEGPIDPTEDEIDADDGGDDWTLSDEDLMMDEESEPHFNAIARTGSGALLIIGERGAGFRSRDDGETWERLQLPYGGSMFGVIGYEGDRVLAYGMRGNAFESHDLGESWQAVDTDTELTFMGGTALGADGFVLVGANGVVVVRSRADAPLRSLIYVTPNQETPVLSGVLARPDGSLLVSGEKGVGRFVPKRTRAAEE